MPYIQTMLRFNFRLSSDYINVKIYDSFILIFKINMKIVLKFSEDGSKVVLIWFEYCLGWFLTRPLLDNFSHILDNKLRLFLTAF